jgi:hypothetical protein
MARTSKNSKKKPSQAVVGRQAPGEAWTPDQLLAAFDNRTEDQRIGALKAAGIIDANGKLAKLYKDWGKKVTRTPDADA